MQGRDNDPDYEGLEDSEDIETSLTKDWGLPTMNEVGPSNLLPKTRNGPVVSQEGTPDTRPMTDSVKWKTSQKARVPKEQDIQDEDRTFELQTKILGIASPPNALRVAQTSRDE